MNKTDKIINFQRIHEKFNLTTETYFKKHLSIIHNCTEKTKKEE